MKRVPVSLPREKFVDVPGGRFGYLEAGDANAPVALCLHGFPDHAPTWAPVMAELAAAGYRAVAPWMRGYAPSVLGGPYDMDQLGDDACALAAALSPDEPVALVGHDWGAVATYAAIASAPELFRAAVTMAVPHPMAFARNMIRYPRQLRRSWYMFFFQLPRVPERVVPAKNFAFIDRLWRSWSPSLRPDPDAMAALKQCLARSMPAPIDYYRAQFRQLGQAPARMAEASANPITVPTLCLMGDEDGCIAPTLGDGQERLFAGEFRADIVGGVGHFMQAESPARVSRAVIDWLDAHPG